MAYQNVGTPRFYIDYFSHWHSTGFINGILSPTETNINGSFLGLDPISPFIISGEPNESGNFSFSIDLNDNLPHKVLDSINYIG